MNLLLSDLVEFVFAQHNRLSCIIRFNNTPKLAEESVAEHSYYVAFISMVIADYISMHCGVKVDKEKLMKMALLHDLEEIVSGDIIKVLKSGGFKEELDRMNKKSMDFLVGNLADVGYHYYSLWDRCKKKTTVEAKIIDLCDWLAMMIYCVREIHLGNRYFKEMLEFIIPNMPKYTKGLSCLNEVVNTFSEYASRYLADDKEISDAIDKAVRMQPKE